MSRRRLPSVSSLLIQTQHTFPDSARACSRTPLGQACLGQRRARAVRGKREAPAGEAAPWDRTRGCCCDTGLAKDEHVTLKGPDGRKEDASQHSPIQKSSLSHPKQELDAPFPMSPHNSHEPLHLCQGAGEFQAGRKAFTETPSHSFPPRDAISSDTLPRRDLHGKFHGRLPSLLCSLMPALGLCSHTTLAQGAGPWAHHAGVPHGLAVPSQEGIMPCQGTGAAGSDSEQPGQLLRRANGG